jgi:hypothetical protein
MTATYSEQEIDRLARKRARMQFGWLSHAAVYVLVNLALAAAAYASGRHWRPFPLLGWGLGLALHGMAVWLAMPGNRWFEQRVQRERQRLLRGR